MAAGSKCEVRVEALRGHSISATDPRVPLDVHTSIAMICKASHKATCTLQHTWD